MRPFFFGLGDISVIDSLLIYWPGPDNRKEKIINVSANQLLVVDINASQQHAFNTPVLASNAMFTNVTKMVGVDFRHQEMDYIDFDKERLLPHKLSQFGPGLAIADVDGNGLDDIFIGGSGDYPGKFLMQQPNGKIFS
jgi:hypothetical protein